MVITRWDPFRDAAALQKRVNSLFQDFTQNRTENDLLTAGNFVPPLDIYEDDHNVTLKLEIPGIRPEDLDVQVEGNTLTIRGERKFDKEEKEENFHRVEHHYGSFYRAFTLPAAVDAGKIQAEYENGILRLKLDKKAEAKPKSIKVKLTSGPKQVEAAKPAQVEPAKTA